jgi:predicted RND superfamily exporter protein
MARRPLLALIIALSVCAGAATGFVRFSVDAGQSLLVGSSSAAGQANQQFTGAFGTDPIVVVLTAQNPTAPYIERNLQRLTALEEDLAHDPRVAEVLGPGTVAHSVLSATTAEVATTFTEYPYFVAETDYLVSRQKGETDTNKLQTQFQNDITNAKNLLALYVARAAADAHAARAAYDQQATPPTDRILDSREKAAEAAASKDPLPPLFAEYLAGPSNTVDQASARTFFDRLTAAFGDCDSTIAQLLQISPTCQVYLERILLDLPQCPLKSAVQNSEGFCPPKQQWSAVLPAPSRKSNGSLVSREIITVRLTPAAAARRADVLGVQAKITRELSKGVDDDAYTHANLAQLQQLGPLVPTECGDASQQQVASCYQRYANSPFASVIAGAPLLTYGVVDSMTGALLILFPVVIVLMAILLVAAFRVRGRLWPLLAAVGAGGATLGLSLWTGLSITPAVLAGIPVLVGLGVDYAVQLVARYDEERARGADREQALAEALGRSGPATLTAALATLAGLGALLLIAGVDAGPLVAVPLVAEFALVLCAGVLISWLTAVFVALPAAALRERPAAEAPARAAQPRRADRTLAIADSWRGAVVPAVIVALVGWGILLPRVPVQTDVEQLLAPSLPQLTAINTVRDQTGYSNEVDFLIQGQVAGPYDKGGIPANVTWQCLTAQSIRSVHADQVATATSIADFFIGSTATSATAATGPLCVPTTSPSGSGTSPSPSPGASASSAPSASATAPPSASASPTSRRVTVPQIVLAASTVAAQTAVPSATAAPSASAAASPSGSASAPSATPSPSQAPAKTQTRFLCDLRLLPHLSRTLVQQIPVTTQPCPAIDKYINTWLSPDTTPIDPTAARIAVGVHGTSVADQATLIDSIRNNEMSKPPNGMTAAPAGLAAMAAQAYDNIVSRGLLLNLVPLVIVFLALLAIERDLRRAALPVLPTAIAAGWAPLILFLLGLLPGKLGTTLGSFNPLTVVMGALVIALATEFGVVLLRRFDEEVARGLTADDAAAAALGATGRAIRVSALTLAAGFAVLAISALLPNGLPLLGAFGFTVLIDLGLAIAAVFGIMLPVAVAIERGRPHPVRAVAAAPAAPVAAPVARPARSAGSRRAAAGRGAPSSRRGAAAAPESESQPDADITPPDRGPPPPRRRGVSGRRRPPAAPGGADEAAPPSTPRRPGVSGRRRRPPGGDPPP